MTRIDNAVEGYEVRALLMHATVIRLGLAAVILCVAPYAAQGVSPVSPPAARAASEAERVLAAVNAQRVQRHLPPLTLDARLTAAGLAHARDLVRTGRFEHRGSDGSRVSDRVTRAGYRWSTVAENLAKARSSSPRLVVLMWMNSRGHRENTLNRQCTQMGVAHVKDIWVLVLARPR